MKIALFGAATALCAALTAPGALAADGIKIPPTVRLPALEPLAPACADPAADHFLEVDIAQRPPAGATRVPRLGAWITADGMLHWPFVMRIRNIGDQPFVGKAGLQQARLVEKDLLAKKEKTLTSVPFDRIAAHSGVATRFEFTAPAKDVEKGKFRRVYTLDVHYDKLDEDIVSSRNGDCNLRNNSFSVEFDGGRKEWIYAK